MSKGKNISSLRTRKRLEQQAIDVARDNFQAAVKPVSPADGNNGNTKK